MPDSPPFQVTSLGAAYANIERLPAVVMLDSVRSLYNVGAFFRTADAVRARKMLLAGITAGPPHPGIAKTALGAERTVPWARTPDPAAALEALRADGYTLAAVETSLSATDLFDWRPAFPVCVVFGHEVHGIQPALLERCDVHVRIPMLGLKQSINVATAGGVVLYELLRQYRSLGANAGRRP